MAPRIGLLMPSTEPDEPSGRNRLSNQIDCVLSEELSDILKAPERCPESCQHNAEGQNAEEKVLLEIANIRRQICSLPRSQFEITLKVLLCSISSHNIENAVKMALKIFDVAYIDKLILIAEPFIEEAEDLAQITQVTTKTSLLSKLLFSHKMQKSKIIMKNLLNVLSSVWPCLENLCFNQKIQRLGLANIDFKCFENFYKLVKVPPTILELSKDFIDISDINDSSSSNSKLNNTTNMAFMKFCEKHNVELMTNEKSEEALGYQHSELDTIQDFGLDWTSSYSIYLPETHQCLTKGYIACKSNSSYSP